MSSSYYKKILGAWCGHLPVEKRLVCAFDRVRDIPYGSTGERRPEEIIRQNLGSCSGKHLLLSGLFETMGYETQIVTCMHYFNDAIPPGNAYPAALKHILKNERVIDFHHYVLLNQSGDWLKVDATWDMGIEGFGFPVNVAWDGKSDTKIAVAPIKYYEEATDLIALKEKLLAELPAHDREVRSRFMTYLTRWLESVRYGASQQPMQLS